MLALPFDYGSMLTAFMISGSSLAITFLLSWLITKSEKFLIHWVVAIALMTISMSIYRVDMYFPSPLLGAEAYAILVIGLSFLWGVGREFKCGEFPYRRVLFIAAFMSALVCPPMLAGYDGLSYILLDLAALTILLLTAREYWTIRSEAPLPLGALSAFYVVIAVSFVPCSIELLYEGRLRMGHVPENWAEDLNIGIALGGLAGIGAISLMLNQVRVAREHEIAAETDPLTGLLNRRALFTHASLTFSKPAALIVFDIDHFKQVNDLHGHPKGDEVLTAFAEILKQCSRLDDVAVRLGGEEFALFLPRSTVAIAIIVGERIRSRFSQELFSSSSAEFRSTVSAGVSCVDEEGLDFRTMLQEADQALYKAKRAGRNRIAVHGLQQREHTSAYP